MAALIGTSPERFGSTVNIATILISPFLFFAVLATLGFVLFCFVSYFGVLAFMADMSSLKTGRTKKNWLLGFRIAAFGIMVFGSWSALKCSNSYSEYASRCCAWYLYNFDMYYDVQLSTNKADKVVSLSDGRLLRAAPKTDGGYLFELKRPDGQK